NQAGDIEPVGCGVNSGWAGKVLPNEKRVDWRDPAIEIFDGCFQILRTVVVQDRGPLAGDRGSVRAFDLACRGRGQKGSEDLTPVWLHGLFSLLCQASGFQGSDCRAANPGCSRLSAGLCPAKTRSPPGFPPRENATPGRLPPILLSTRTAPCAGRRRAVIADRAIDQAGDPARVTAKVA